MGEAGFFPANLAHSMCPISSPESIPPGVVGPIKTNLAHKKATTRVRASPLSSRALPRDPMPRKAEANKPEGEDDGKTVCSIDDIVVEYSYDIPSFFNFFDFINVSRFAEFAGVNESKMRAYKSGVSFPGEKTTAKIFRAVRKIGAELTAASLL